MFRTTLNKLKSNLPFTHSKMPASTAATLPATQQAILIKAVGGPSALELVPDHATPSVADLQPTQILVKNVYAGVNFIDTNVRKGGLAFPLPHVPGMEGSGYVVAAGSEAAADFPEGAKIAYMAMKAHSYAAYTVVEAAAATPVPAAIELDAAAASMMQGMTMHYLVESSYQVKSGDWILVHAGSGGMGLLLTQICKAKGAHVVTTVSSAAKAELSKQAGADLSVRYAKDDGSSTDEWVEEARKATPDGAGFNAVYDSVGLTTFTHSLSLIKQRGHVVLFGAASGAPEPIAPLSLGPKSATITRPMLFHFVATKDELRKRAADVFQWLQKGQIKFSYSKFPLEQAAKVHEDLEARKTTGKLLLKL